MSAGLGSTNPDAKAKLAEQIARQYGVSEHALLTGLSQVSITIGYDGMPREVRFTRALEAEEVEFLAAELGIDLGPNPDAIDCREDLEGYEDRPDDSEINGPEDDSRDADPPCPERPGHYNDGSSGVSR